MSEEDELPLHEMAASSIGRNTSSSSFFPPFSEFEFLAPFSAEAASDWLLADVRETPNWKGVSVIWILEGV